MHILFLSRWFPFPPNNGSKIRIYNLLRGLSSQHAVTLLSFVESSEEADIDSALEVCQSVKIIRRKPFNPNAWRARIAFFSATPRSVIDTFSSEMAQAIEQVLNTESIDLLIASQIDMAVYVNHFHGTPAIFEEVEVSVLYEQFAYTQKLTKRLRYGLTWVKHRRYLRSLFQNFEACTVVSAQEKELLLQVVGGIDAIEVLPNCLDLSKYQIVREEILPNTLIFTGAFSYNPNYEAMLWFVGEVLPLIQLELPDVHLTITGNHQGQSLPRTNNVTLTGFVDDIRPLVSQSWVSIVPLLTGGGTRLKILEAMALGTPVVATSKGAEGLEAQSGKQLLVADTPVAFAESVVRVLKDEGLRRQLAEEGTHLVHEKYNWQVILPQFLELIDRIGRGANLPVV